MASLFAGKALRQGCTPKHFNSNRCSTGLVLLAVVVSSLSLLVPTADAQPQLRSIKLAESPDGIDEFGYFTVVEDSNFGVILIGNFTFEQRVYLTASNQACDNLRYPENGFEITPLENAPQNGFVYGRTVLKGPSKFRGGDVFICLDTNHQGNGTLNDPTEVTFRLTEGVAPFLPMAVHILLIVLLLMLSGLFSGLNLGLMALDSTELEIYMASGTPKEQEYAKQILPLRNRGNLLLCTLLLGNVLVNSMAVLLLESLAGGVIAAVVSTGAIVVFGEIVPQSICSRHGLLVGAKTTPITIFFMIITFPAAYPISKILDCMLGEELGSVFQRKELLQLVQLTDKANDLDKDELDIVTGALTYSDKTVEEVMTPIADVFSLPMDAILDYNTITRIVESGHSRIPVTVQNGMRFEIKAVLFVKDMAFVDPDDNMPLETLIKFYRHDVLEVLNETRLDDLLDLFKQRRTHMATVQRVRHRDNEDPEYELIGIVTLEDVIEEIIGAEIHDETDKVTDNYTKKPLSPMTARRDRSTRLSVSGEEVPLEKEEDIEFGMKAVADHLAMAAFTFLQDNVTPFGPDKITRNVLYKLLTRSNPSSIHVIEKNSDEASRRVYQIGQETKVFTLILEGSLDITFGKEQFPIKANAIYAIAAETLSMEKPYIPDFSATADPESRTVLFQLSRAAYKQALQGSKLERMSSVSAQEKDRDAGSRLSGPRPIPRQSERTEDPNVQRLKAVLHLDKSEEETASIASSSKADGEDSGKASVSEV